MTMAVLKPTKEKKQHALKKSRNQTNKPKLLAMSSLVGDEIPHCGNM
jgi:hypothetical protein